MMIEIKPSEIAENPIKLIAKDWMLVTAGDASNFNTMTASWGTIGEMWGFDVVETVIRPQRYTKEYIDKAGRFTLSFFPEEMRPLLAAMGKNSGRDIDKMHYPGLEVVELPSGALTFKGAKLVVETETVYVDRFAKDAFVDPAIEEKWYDGDWHYRYIGRILHVWQDNENTI